MPNPYVITDEMIDDIVTTALEGGINYWAMLVESNGPEPVGESRDGGPLFTSEFLTHGGALKITEHYELQGEDYKPLILTKEAMIRGIREAAKSLKVTPEIFWENHDAGVADRAVQLAVFGEIVYA